MAAWLGRDCDEANKSNGNFQYSPRAHAEVPKAVDVEPQTPTRTAASVNADVFVTDRMRRINAIFETIDEMNKSSGCTHIYVPANERNPRTVNLYVLATKIAAYYEVAFHNNHCDINILNEWYKQLCDKIQAVCADDERACQTVKLALYPNKYPFHLIPKEGGGKRRNKSRKTKAYRSRRRTARPTRRKKNL